MRKVAKVFLSIGLLIVSVFVGIYLWAELNKVPLQNYDETVTYNYSNYPGLKNVTIYYDLCFQNGTFVMVDDNPGFAVQVHCKLTVLKEGARAANANVSITNSSYDGSSLDIRITSLNPTIPCSLEPGSAEMFCVVIIDRDLWVGLEAHAGYGNLNLTAEYANFTTASLQHGVNCPGNILVNMSHSVVHEDLIVAVSNLNTATYTVILHSTIIVGEQSITPPGKGTITIT